jgi:hypothetical protein
MIRQDILDMLIQSGRVSIIPVGFEGEGENEREGEGDGI